MKEYRLGSTEFVSAPGMVRWCINAAGFPRDRAQMINVISATWNVPPEAARALLLQQVPFTVEGETVVFTA